MEIPVTDFGGGSGGQLAVADGVFARKYNAALAHQALTSVLANARLATRQQKNARRSSPYDAQTIPPKRHRTGARRSLLHADSAWRRAGFSGFAA